MKQENCPFCDSRPRSENSWMCGTIGPDQNGEYYTPTSCNETVFRKGFIRCHDLLVDLVDGSTSMAFKSDGVVIPRDLWEKVLDEVNP